MSISDKLLPQGGLSVGNSVYVLGIHNNTLYILTSPTLTTAVMVPVYNNASINSTLNPLTSQRVIFTLGFQGDAITFTSNTSYLSNSSGVLSLSVINTLSTEPIYLSQNVYTPFSSPELILSSVLYSIYGGSSFEPLMVTLPDTTTVIMPIIVVPTSYFSGCSSGNSTPISDFNRVMNTTYCSHFNSTWCSSINSEAWVSQVECREGISYTYCPNGTTCNGTCKSACLKDNSDPLCTHNGSSFECSDRKPNVIIVNSSKTPTTPVEPSDTWWIIAIVITIVIIMAIIIYSLYHSKAPKTHHVNQYQHQSITRTQQPIINKPLMVN